MSSFIVLSFISHTLETTSHHLCCIKKIDFSGAGIVGDEFDIDRLLAFTETYQSNPHFCTWVRSCDWRILHRLEALAPQPYSDSVFTYPDCPVSDIRL